MKTFSTVASMKLATLNPEQFVETGGYYEKGGAGAARYFVKTAAQAALDGDTIDGYGNHSIANGNVAVLQYEGVVNVEWFGAMGDGVTDDTNSFNAASSMSSESVYVPYATYTFGGATLIGQFHSYASPVAVNGTITILNLNP